MTLGSILISLLLAIISDELLAWSPRLADWLLRKSTSQLPSSALQERMLEEWRGVLSDRPGKLSKLWFAADTFRASYRIAHYHRTPHISALNGLSMRSFDVLVSAITFITAFFPVVIITIVVKLFIKGPALIKTERIGRDRRVIHVYKFKTISIDKQGSTYLTKTGGLIRKTRLDELPMLINVFRGDLSMIGPRPVARQECREHINEIRDYAERFSVRPGLSGLAQINLWRIYESPPPNEFAQEELSYDLAYIKHSSVLLNIRIIVCTTLYMTFQYQGCKRLTAIRPQKHNKL